MPAARTPAQQEAARRNGARSRGPVTPEGKARSSRNALKHGLAATAHLLVPGEDGSAFDALLADLLAEHAPATSLEAMLLRRLASALWRQERADRLEAAQFAWVEPRRALRAERFVPVDPEADVCLASLDAIRRGREAAAREVSRILRELRSLRREPLAAGTDEPEPAAAAAQNEPEPRRAARPAARTPAAANGNAPNESGPALAPAERAEVEAMIASGEPGLILAAAARVGMLEQVAPLFAGGATGTPANATPETKSGRGGPRARS